MRNYQICTKTVMDTSDPNIKFDRDGISNHYWNYHNNIKKYWKPNEEGRKILEQKVLEIKKKSKSKEFDCIMGLSGGADSSFMLHKMVTEYDLRPLVFHVDGGWNSEIAVNNINSIIDKLDLDLFTEVIDWDEMRDFQLSMFKSGVPHLDIPQDMAFIGVLYKFAEKYNIKYILNGGNISTECVLMPLQILYWATDMVHIRDILGKYGIKELKNYPFSNILYHKFYLRYIKGISVLKPLNFMPYNKKEAIDELVEVYNWKPYAQKHFESRFTRFFEGYWLPTRFNYDMRRNQFSSLILTGQMSREEAIQKLMEPPYSIDEVKKDFSFVASKLGIESDELDKYHKMPKKYFWDYKNNKILFDVGETILKLMTGTQRGGAL